LNRTVTIELLPLGRTLRVPAGTPLADVLFAQGVEFPCGGRGRCKGCRVKILAGKLPVTADDARLLTTEELAAGWRLSCRARADGDLKLELVQWEAAILADDSRFAFTPHDDLGVAVDLGTTTIVAQLLDRRRGHVLGVRLALNQQARYGADIMSRIDHALAPEGLVTLRNLIRRQLGEMIAELIATAAPAGGALPPLRDVVIVGNTVMHHLFCGVSVEPLSHHPFVPDGDGLRVFSAAELGWNLPGATVHFLPCLGGFVGSDILAGVLATKLHESAELVGLVDLGTNGEIVIGNRDRLLCASTAAGPAFEGARISMGMRAATGAIAEVSVTAGRLQCRVLGHVAPRGLCGSGLVDAVAAGLDLGWIRPNGRLADGTSLTLAEPVKLTQADIRELQLAKGAIAAGIRLLLGQWGATPADLTRLHLAGAFGNYINRASARRIGLLDFPLDKVAPAGNTALLGAKLALFDLPEHAGDFPELRRRIQHVSLNEDPQFHEIYVEEMGFPE
jgi:uncharacterized 2Fe-2S/4Fe-4S cluster protein (DUF4445 family)